ncbi:MAG: 2-succinyl-5-enolpyruvyl-6-hydroxy-3-cyclohexene-1-carboxylic-acid synthase [Candidatus Hydrogenedentota bacterium]
MPFVSDMNRFWAGLIVEELTRLGVDAFFLSPGSRCTPLTLAAAEHAAAQAAVHFDERASAFAALGFAKETGRPAALVCTSGTAAVNYWPAIAEAAMSGVPLLVLTADRPPELQSTGANQAIDQQGLYGGYVRWAFTLPCPSNAIAPEMVLTTVDQAVYRAGRSPRGPVQLNCMFREPLAPPPGNEWSGIYGESVARWKESAAPYTRYTPEAREPALGSVQAVAEALGECERGIVVLGELASHTRRDDVAAMLDALGWPVFPDIASGFRLGAAGRNVVHHYGALLLSEAAHALRPDGVLHLGGPVTSKRLLTLLHDHPPRRYVMAADHPERRDPLHRVTLRLECAPDAFCRALANLDVSWEATLHRDWLVKASAEAGECLDAYMEAGETLSEPLVARLISRAVPPDSVLFLGNSMPIRDMDTFAAADGPHARVHVSRGASGIDGCVATAAGLALAAHGPVTAILGDLAVLHDLNALNLLRGLEHPFVLVVINNDGGGIFSFLPIAQHEHVFEPYFATPHGLRFEDAARMFGLRHVCPGTPAKFSAAYGEAIKRGGATLIEVITDRERNYAVHREIEEMLQSAPGAPQ